MPGKRGRDDHENDEEKKERKRMRADGFRGAVNEW
jgi:hypothetical protein